VDELSQAKGFDWDEWNAPKIWEKHSVSQAECEQVFFNEPLVVAGDAKHSEEERRYYLLGMTDQGRLLFLVFTLRADRIRVITARDIGTRSEGFIEMSKKKAIPNFKSEDLARDFWAEHDSSEHVDWSSAKKAVFPQLRPSTKTISLRLPEALLEDLKYLANKRDVPYQSLLKIYLAERVEDELRAK
jgi:uncharacterized DUF497 family protein/predicted DNA binding CopG/RHH family protein